MASHLKGLPKKEAELSQVMVMEERHLLQQLTQELFLHSMSRRRTLAW